MDAAEIVASWGWESPRPEVLAQAEHVAQIAGDVGRALEALGVLDAQVVARLKANCPKGSDLLEYAVQEQSGKVQPYVEMVTALVNRYPFYEQLGVLEKHPAMAKDPGVAARCEHLDCAMMLIEAARPVIVFASFKAMMQWKMAGRSGRMADPLVAAAGVDTPFLAVGSRDDISAIIGQHRNSGDAGVGDSDRVYNSNSNEVREHPEQRELVRLLDHAIEVGASDISLVPLRDGSYSVLVRKWGALSTPRTAAKWPAALASNIIQVLEAKSGANPSSTNYREPRDGHISYRSSVGDAFLRLSFIPLNHRGDLKNRKSVSIRLFSNSDSRIDLDRLGLPDEVVEAIDASVRMPSGLILLVGPMNSGKSSTIAAAMGRHAQIYGATKKRVSVEDPIERFVADVTQVEVPSIMHGPSGERISDNDRFNTILRGSKRHDINAYWIGEVRDAESAGFCVSIASSGHLGLSTLHAKNSILAFDILSKMVDADMRFQLAESLTLIVSQRLAPGLCPHCKVQSKPTAEEKRQWAVYMKMEGDDKKLPATLWRASESGCKECDDGYMGYRPVCEVLPFTRGVRDAAGELLGSGSRSAREAMAGGRTLTLIDSALRLMKAGEVDLPSVIHL